MKLKNIFKKSEKESKPSVSTRKIKDWIEDGLARGYELGDLRERLIKHGLEKQAVNLIHTFPHPHKTYHSPHKKYSQKKINTILLIVCALILALIIAFVPNGQNQNLIGIDTGGHTQEGEVNTIQVDTTPHFKKGAGPLVENITETGNNIQIVTGGIISEGENPGAIVNVNFNDEIGKVRGDFYGVNTHGIYLTNCGDDDINTLWYKQQFLDSGMKYIRADTNLHLYANSDGTFNSCLINRYSRLVNWSRENNIKILWIMGYMPSWLANTTEKCASKNITCPPTNYSRWGQLNTDFLKAIGCDKGVCMVEVWNEPELTGILLSDAGTNDSAQAERSKEYNLIYNASYLAIKSVYPEMIVGGPSYTSDGGSGDKIIQGFLGNFSDKMDFVSYHRYIFNSEEPTNFNDLWNTKVGYLIANCSFYKANCTNIIMSEFNYQDNTDLLTNTNRFNELGTKFSLAYVYGLNNLPSNITFIQYEWTGSQYQMLNITSGIFYPSFNVTKNFATYHSAGSMVVNSNSSSSNIKVVASKKDDSEHITVINTGSEINLGLNIYGENISQLEDLETNQIYNVTDGGVYIGSISQYQIRYFVSLNNPVPLDEELNQLQENSLIESIGDNTPVDEEQCDYTYLDTQTCEELGYSGGILSYKAGCIIDTSQCINDSYNKAKIVGAVGDGSGGGGGGIISKLGKFIEGIFGGNSNSSDTTNITGNNIGGQGSGQNNQDLAKNINDNNIESNQKTGETKLTSSDNIGTFSLVNIIFYSLVGGILILITFITVTLVRIRKLQRT